ncbi:unnamed protein product [Pleuronectes platessa]|uniref:Uncharacterized protein n=1 Tax=Pleuronectes platessa TaxID=8262 RepID=A0A9N7V162_PLEPL|nr:unnamed protein product [Pleuronectes platessa]
MMKPRTKLTGTHRRSMVRADSGAQWRSVARRTCFWGTATLGNRVRIVSYPVLLTAGETAGADGSRWRQSSGSAQKRCVRKTRKEALAVRTRPIAPWSKDAQELRSPHTRWSSWGRGSAADVLHPVRLSCPSEPRAHRGLWTSGVCLLHVHVLLSPRLPAHYTVPLLRVHDQLRIFGSARREVGGEGGAPSCH